MARPLMQAQRHGLVQTQQGVMMSQAYRQQPGLAGGAMAAAHVGVAGAAHAASGSMGALDQLKKHAGVLPGPTCEPGAVCARVRLLRDGPVAA